MRRKSISLVLAILLFFSLVSPHSTAVNASAIGKAGDTVTNVRADWLPYNLRTEPRMNLGANGSLARNESAKILAVVTGDKPDGFTDQWYKISWKGSERYVIVDPAGQTITPGSTPTTPPTTAPTPAPSTGAQYGDVLLISRSDSQNYNIRSVADATVNNIIGTAVNGNRFVILGILSGKVSKANDTLWYKVWYNGQSGYVLVEPGHQTVLRGSGTVLTNFKTAYERLQTSETERTRLAKKVTDYGNIEPLLKAANGRTEKTYWLNELNAGRSPITPATTKYFNLFNVYAFAVPDKEVIDGNRMNGVNFAMGGVELSSDPVKDKAIKAEMLLPWTSEQAAATGGARWIINQYIERKQETVFYQKFNLKGQYYWQQYMQAVEAPRSESAKIYSAYYGSNTLHGEIVFRIPYFSGMPQLPSPDPANTTVVPTYDFTLTLEQVLQVEGIDPVKNAKFVEDIAGFPDVSYWKPLIELHREYPQWRFIAEKAKDSWSTALLNQVDPENRSLIENYSHNKAYIKNGTVYDGSNWVPVNSAGVSYFMDPRNFLNVSQANPSRNTTHVGQIFMFFSIADVSGAEKIEGVRYMFRNNSDLYALADEIMVAAKDVNTSAYFLASRMQQEVTDTRYGHYIANNARGTIDLNYPPLNSGQDSVSFMNSTQQKAAINEYLLRIAPQANKYDQYLIDKAAYDQAVKQLSTNTSNLTTVANSLSTAATTVVDGHQTVAPKPFLRGDVNGDGRVSTTDMIFIQHHVLKIKELTDDQLSRADVNEDGRISTTDMIFVFHHVLKIRPLF